MFQFNFAKVRICKLKLIIWINIYKSCENYELFE